MNYKSGALTHVGGNSSDSEVDTGSTSNPRKYSMFMEAKMKKEERLLFGTDTEVPTKDGESSTKEAKVLSRNQPQELIITLDSSEVEPSISDQECQ
jgi:hypothetical protein